MNAMEYIEERNRMCKSFCGGCNGCPAFNVFEDDLCCAVGQESKLDATEQIAIVEKWSIEHPRKTRQSVFIEQYPDAQLDAYGVLRICPADISAEYRCGEDRCLYISKGCVTCRREFWMKKVKEDK